MTPESRTPLAPQAAPSAARGHLSIATLVEREARRLRAIVAAGGASVAVGAAALLLAAGAALFADARWISLPAALPAVLWLLAVAAAVAVLVVTARAVRSRA